MSVIISISGTASISALGEEQNKILNHYNSDDHLFQKRNLGKGEVWLSELKSEIKNNIEQLKNSNPKYKKLDPSVLYAIYSSRKAIKKAGWNSEDIFGINFGSSRGATFLFEKYHEDFLNDNKLNTLSSPTTTLGNISTWVANDLQSQGPHISHSITCSTGLHSILNGVAWIKSGMVDKFLVGASEAPLTPFTIAQMQALRIYSESKSDYPCRALDFSKKENTMILGEGAAAICLEKGVNKNSIVKIEGVGYATEIFQNNTSISEQGLCFQKSMQMAIGKLSLDEVDVIVMHAPGTIKGDMAELNAINKVFKNSAPALTSNKWKIGHTFATSGILSLEMAIHMIQNDTFFSVPYIKEKKKPEKIKKVLVNAVGFGGNAVSILISKI